MNPTEPGIQTWQVHPNRNAHRGLLEPPVSITQQTLELLFVDKTNFFFGEKHHLKEWDLPGSSKDWAHINHPPFHRMTSGRCPAKLVRNQGFWGRRAAGLFNCPLPSLPSTSFPALRQRRSQASVDDNSVPSVDENFVVLQDWSCPPQLDLVQRKMWIWKVLT